MKKSVRRLKKRSKAKLKVQKELSHIPDKFRQMVAEDVRRYLNVIGMNHYRTQIAYMHKDSSKDSHTCGDGKVAAEAAVDMRYLTLSVKIYPFIIEDWKKKHIDDEDVHHIIAHEMAHVATQHMYRLATSVYKDEGETKDAWESLTTIIGRLVHEVDKRRRGFKRGNEK